MTICSICHMADCVCGSEFYNYDVRVNIGPPAPPPAPPKHAHYFKDVGRLKSVDVYRVLALWGVTDPCIQHAVKKLLVAGGRGAGKSPDRDVQEAIDSLERWKAMRAEDSA